MPMRLEVIAAGLWVLLGANVAWATDEDTPEEPVPITIRGAEPGVTLHVVAGDDKDHAVATCRGACSFSAVPGSYTVFAVDDRTGEEHDVGLRVRRAGDYRFTAGDHSMKKAGLALGIGGPILVGVGVLLTMPVVLSSMCEDTNCTSQGERTAALAGLGAIALGAIATPIGWSLFGMSRDKLVDLREEEEDAAARPSRLQMRLGAGALAPGVFGIVGTGQF